MENSIIPYFEALKLLKDWSAILLTLQTIIFIYLTSVCLLVDNEKLLRVKYWLITSLTFSALSIVISLNVIGTIPWSIQNLPNLVTQYHNIYQFTNFIGIPIWVLAFGQHVCFIFALVCLMVFIYRFLRGSLK